MFPWIRTNVSTLAQDYYFISTSSPEDVNSTSGGYCQSHNMKVVFKVMSEETMMKKQKQEEMVVGKEVFRINSEVRPMTDHVEMASKGEEEKRRDLARKRRRKERRGRQREAVMRMEEEEEVEEVKDVKEMRSEWRREEPLAKPSLTGASASLETLSVSLLLLSLVALAMLPQN